MIPEGHSGKGLEGLSYEALYLGSALDGPLQGAESA